MHHVVSKWNGVDLAGLVHALGDEPEGGWPPDLSAAVSIQATSFKNQLNSGGLQDWLDDDGDTTVLQPSIMVGADVVLKSDAGWLVVLTLKLYSSRIKRDAFDRNVATSNLFDCYTTTAGKTCTSCRASRRTRSMRTPARRPAPKRRGLTARSRAASAWSSRSTPR